MSNPQLEASAVSAKVNELARKHPKTKKSTREKIDKLVAEGAKNYPAYLKLIYTGDSELSSEDEFCADNKTKLNGRRGFFPKINAEPDSAVMAEASTMFSPESAKLLDPGREKLPTPVEQSGSINADVDASQSCIDESPTGHETYEEADTETLGSELNESQYMTEEEKELEELRLELNQVQEDITTLKSVLNTKMKVAADLKRKLGITPMSEFKQSLQNIKESGTYQRTNAAFRSFGAFASRKMGNFRNSSVFKSVEEKVGGAYGTVKQSRSMGNIQSRMTTMSSSRSENNVAEMTMHATDPIDDESKSDDAMHAISNPYADM